MFELDMPSWKELEAPEFVGTSHPPIETSGVVGALTTVVTVDDGIPLFEQPILGVIVTPTNLFPEVV